jgi:hypothetical protein
VVAIVVEDDEVAGLDLMLLTNLLQPLARYCVPVRSKRTSVAQ